METVYATKQAYIWQVLASAEQAATLEGVDRNVAALSELRGKYWLQRPFFCPERKINIPESITGIFGVFFSFYVGSSDVKQAQSDPWKN